MSTTERVAVTCPGCSRDEPTAHEVLKQAGMTTVRCTECGHVHKVELEEEETVERRVIVSQEGESFTTQREAPPDESVEKGDEFLVETDEAIMTVRVTSIEKDGHQRSARADYGEVETLWTRAVGNVSVNVTLHPKDGGRDDTRSTKLHVPGEEEFVVGMDYEYGDEEFTVEGLIIREDAFEDYDFEQLDFDGDSAYAKDIKRLYARDQTSTAWSAW